jgi:hypothetical protein
MYSCVLSNEKSGISFYYSFNGKLKLEKEQRDFLNGNVGSCFFLKVTKVHFLDVHLLQFYHDDLHLRM